MRATSRSSSDGTLTSHAWLAPNAGQCSTYVGCEVARPLCSVSIEITYGNGVPHARAFQC
jgi:hypothetical protein